MEVLGRSSRHLARMIFTAMAVAVFAWTVAGCGGDEDDGGDSSDQLNGLVRVPPLEAKKASLPDVSPQSGGKPVAMKGEPGGLMLVFFGFTSCPDVCPTTLADLRIALGELEPGQREKVKVSMVTVDPKRDSVKALNEYLGFFFEEGQFSSFRTENPAQLAKVEEAFNASHEIGKPDPDGDYDVGHTAMVYAVDDEGTVQVEWPFKIPTDQIASDLKSLLSSS